MTMDAKIYLEDSQYLCNGGYEEKEPDKKKLRKKKIQRKIELMFHCGSSVVKACLFKAFWETPEVFGTC